MRLESNLCHFTENKVIVRVKGWVDDKTIGSALGEGLTVESAEDHAIKRLNQRISQTNTITQKSNTTNNQDIENTKVADDIKNNQLNMESRFKEEPNKYSSYV